MTLTVEASVPRDVRIPGVGLDPSQVDYARLEPLREYAARYLPMLICDMSTIPSDEMNPLAIRLEHPFTVPSNDTQEGFDYNYQQFYWDTYFNARGLMRLDERNHTNQFFEVVNGMLQNSTNMFEEFKIIPNSNLHIRRGHSQPPLLTSYIFDMYRHYKDTYPSVVNQQWLTAKIAVAKREYETVWMGTKDPHNRLIDGNNPNNKLPLGMRLNRNYDPDVTDDHLQAEHGWDYTPRFEGQAPKYCPADLNAMLYKYERDFALEAQMRGDTAEERKWLQRASDRRNTMNRVMYDKKTGVYRDYNHQTGQQGPVASLASYVAMWAGMVKPGSNQAREMVTALKLFERPGGLMVTQEYKVPDWERRELQWMGPNSFSSVTMLTVDGLARAGFPEVAKRVARKSLGGKILWLEQHGNTLEAYNARDPHEPPRKGMYPRQINFGWTAAEILDFGARYVDPFVPAVIGRGAVFLGN